MKRLNRREEAVSPVIATILMVAITVVLAATLYMMVGDIGGDRFASVTVSYRVEDYDIEDGELDLELYFSSMSTPSSAEIDDLDIRIIYQPEDESVQEYFLHEHWEEEELSWSGLDGGDVASGTTMYLSGHVINIENGEMTEDNVDRVELRISGYDGAESANF